MFAVTHLQSQVVLPMSHVATLLNNAARNGLSGTQSGTTVGVWKQQYSRLAISKCRGDSAFNELSEACQKSLEKTFLCCTELNLIDFEHLTTEELKLTALGLLSNHNCCTVNPWKVSHVSAQTFFENKAKALFCTRTFPATLSRHLTDYPLLSKYQHFFRQQRYFSTGSLLCFKTKRAENITGISGNRDEVGSDQMIFGKRLSLGSIYNKDAINLDKDVDKNVKLKQMLSNAEPLPSEQKEKIKVSFAEGYVAGIDKGKTGGSKLRVFNIIRDLMGIVLIVALLGTFVGGPFRKVLIGNGNEVHPEEIDVSFDDVKGVEEAKQELLEIVDFLRSPEKYSRLGAKLPKGVLLVGPPGTGKTLLARAVAGEAGVPFFHSAGPEFDEILVGQGARRVRDLFSTAKARAPCVIFIDEIDSVGAKRTSSVLHPYANQTINQLLAEMDGFRQNEGVIVLGATNRREDLDKALLRPGRFDVEVQVPVPDLRGRVEILELYLGKIKRAEDVDVNVLARGTTGFTGADLENLVNQAALRAAIDGLSSVPMDYMENARDKVLMGPEKKSRIPDDDANKITAYHEGGHTVVAYFTKDSHPLHKVTIIPRGFALGHTAYIPEKESYHTKKSQMLAMLDILMGGRVAEELIFGSENITSGASDDLKKATQLATLMVKEWGMSEKVGVRTFEENKNQLVTSGPEVGHITQELIDAEIKRFLNESYERAKNILRTRNKEHHNLANALLMFETLDADEIKLIMEGKPVPPRRIRTLNKNLLPF